jgi:hypothetical protein
MMHIGENNFGIGNLRTTAWQDENNVHEKRKRTRESRKDT